MTKLNKLEASADYRHGVDMAAIVACRMVRNAGCPDELWLRISRAMNELRDTRPLYGAAPASTEPEGEMFREQIEAHFSA